MKITGKIWKFGDDVNTDDIIPARYLNTISPEELAKHCMEDIRPEFANQVSAGDIIVAGKNFGCGSSREHAPLALKGCSVSGIVASSYARIFYRNAINIGLPILECTDLFSAIHEKEQLEIDLATGTITIPGCQKSFQAASFPPFMQELINSGGLRNYVRKKTRPKE